MLKSLMWIGATAVALVGGIAYYHGEEIADASHQIAAVGHELDREFAKAESDIDSGADPDDAIERAIAQALLNSGVAEGMSDSDIDELEQLAQLDDRNITIESENDGESVTVGFSNVVVKVREKLQEAQVDLEQKRVSGELSEERYQEALQAIADAEAKIARVRDRVGVE